MNHKFKEYSLELENLLKVEKEILLSGELDSLKNLLPLKENLIENLQDLADVEVKWPVDIMLRIKENQELLDCALAGIRRVAQRLSNFRNIQTKLETYNANGQKTVVASFEDITVHKLA